MQKIVKTVNGADYSFYNNSYGNRSGFVHTCELIRNGLFILGKNKCQYYNRTWECYTYQSVMKGLVYNLIEECKESYNPHGKKNMESNA